MAVAALMIATPVWSAQGPPLARSDGHDALARIEAAHLRGELSFDDAVRLKATLVTHPERLPYEFRTTSIQQDKCATDILLDVRQNLDRVSEPVRAELAAMLARPNTSDYFDSPAGYFRIHYSLVGPHAVPLADLDASGVPDYVEQVADYADSSWHQEVLNYGYYPPPGDGGTGGGSNLYDIYCQDIPYYGYTQPENPGPAAWNDYSSYIVVHNDFLGFPANTDPDGNQAGAAKVTVAHEFMHACQFAYDVNESGWWMEATATWAEDEVFDPVNDNYNYLPGFFTAPQLSLYYANGGHEYGAFIWPRYLSERFGPSVILAIWQDCITNSALSSMDAVLAGLGTSRDVAFAQFTAWDWITRTRDDGVHYEEGSAYPQAPAMRTHSVYPVLQQTSSQVPSALASNYISFVTSGVPAGRPVAFTFNGDDSQKWAASVAARGPGGTFDILPFTLDELWQGTVTLPSAGSFTEVALVPANIGVTGSGNYTYSACVGPLPPDVLTPDEGATVGIPAVLEWEAVAGAVSYRVQVDLDSAFDAPYFDSTLTATSAQVGGLVEGAIYYWRIAMTDDCATSNWGATRSFRAQCSVVLTGDVNVDSAITAADIIALVNYIFKGGIAPQPIPQAGDVNCSGDVTSGDIINLVSHVFKGAAAPCDVCSIL